MGPGAASPTTTVPSVFMPRIAPPYTPNSITWRPSSVAPRDHLGGELHALAAHPRDQELTFHAALQHELLQVRDVILGRATAGDERVVHAPDREVVDRVGVALRVAAGVGHRVAQRAHEELARASHLLGEPIGEPGVVDRERPGVVGRGGVAGLLHDAADHARTRGSPGSAPAMRCSR